MSKAARDTKDAVPRHRIALALIAAFAAMILGMAVPAAAQAAPPPPGPYTVSGTLTFPAGIPAQYRQPVDSSLPYDQQTGVVLSLDIDQNGPVEGWTLGTDPNVSYTPSTGQWSVTGVSNGAYRITAYVRLPKNASAGTSPSYPKVTVSGANLTAPTLAVAKQTHLRVATGSCTTYPTLFAKNTGTGVAYPLQNNQSGSTDPDTRCGGTSVSYGNSSLPANAPEGDYVVYGEAGGVREYLTANGLGSRLEADAKSMTAKFWEGNDQRWLFGLSKAPVLPKPDRLAGADRYSTAAAVSKSSYPTAGSASTVVLSSGTVFADSLSATPLASKLHAPMLLTAQASLPQATSAEIARLKPTKVIIIGGTGAVSASIEAQLKKSYTVTRYAGADRYATSRAIATGGWGSSQAAFIATGAGFADGLAAGAAAGTQSAPLLLVDGGAAQVPGATTSLLGSLGVTQITIAGGTGAVSAGIENSLKSTVGAGGSVVRGAGADRFTTAAWFAKKYSTSGGTVYIANGMNFPDALAGAAAAGAIDAPLVLSQQACLPASSLGALQHVAPTQVHLLGGTGALAPAVAAYVRC